MLVLPSLFTTGNLLSGFYALLLSLQKSYSHAAYAILAAALFDLLDGRVARMTKSQSDFGVEYDSLADIVSFGVAPAFLSYCWALQSLGRWGIAAAFFFVACAGLRLARFNVLAGQFPKSYFIGLPTPAAANLVAAAILAYEELHLPFPKGLFFVLLFALGFLMVSSIRYRSFKDFDIRHRRSFFELIVMLALIVIATVHPEVTLAFLFAYYVGWGPTRELLRRLRSGGLTRFQPVLPASASSQDMLPLPGGEQS